MKIVYCTRKPRRFSLTLIMEYLSGRFPQLDSTELFYVPKENAMISAPLDRRFVTLLEDQDTDPTEANYLGQGIPPVKKGYYYSHVMVIDESEPVVKELIQNLKTAKTHVIKADGTLDSIRYYVRAKRKANQSK